MSRSTLSYQKWPLIVTVIGLGLSGWLGWATTGTLSGVFRFLLVGAILATLEIALSFDNAIVNANKLEEMTPIWLSSVFLTWGILIAVFWHADNLSLNDCGHFRPGSTLSLRSIWPWPTQRNIRISLNKRMAQYLLLAVLF